MKTVKEKYCKECGRIVNSPTDQELRKADRVETVGIEQCGCSDTPDYDREKRL